MKTVGLEKARLETCIDDAQRERVLITRDGKPLALIVNVEGMDSEQLQLSSSSKFWEFITERRSQKTVGRTELEEILKKK